MVHLIGFILILGVVLGMFIIYSLIRTKKDALPQRMLIVFWFFLCGIFLHFYGQLNNLPLLKYMTFPVINISQIFLPVLAFLYVKSIFYKGSAFLKKNSWHLIPTLIYIVIYVLPTLINFFNDPPIFPYAEKVDLIFMTLLKDAYGILYFLLAFQLLKKAQKQLRHLFSDFSKHHFSWLNTFLWSFFGIIIIDFIFTLSEFVFNYSVVWDGYISVILLIVVMLYLAYFGIQQISLFIPDFVVQGLRQAPLNAVSLVELDSKLKRLLEIEKPYLIPNLTLNDLAQKVDISEKNLSYFLNNYLNISFYDLINRHRVEEAKQQLKAGALEKYSIAGIGQLCGFSSKTSFHRVFKKETGLTPLAYKKLNDQ